MAAIDLYNLCREYLEACSEAVAMTPAGPIGRQFVSPGVPAWDCCPQLTVHAGGPAEGDTAVLTPPLQPGFRPTLGLVDLIAMTATVIRCVPVLVDDGSLPSAPAIDKAAQNVLEDCWAIWNHVLTRVIDGTLFVRPDGQGQREVFLDPAVALNAAGGCAGWQIQVRVQLGGYRTI